MLAYAAMEELVFVVEEPHDEVRDAVRCHFDDGKAPKIIRLHFVHDQVISA